MKVFKLQLPEPTAWKLHETAQCLCVTPEQLAILSIEGKLAQIDEEFGPEYVLQKNAHVYRRLT